jgi:hypothetical protein
VASRNVEVEPRSLPGTTEALAPGEAVEVYFWSRREWCIGTFELDDAGAPFIVVSERALRFEAALLMGLRRLLH